MWDLLWKKLIKLFVFYFDINVFGEIVSCVMNDMMVVKELIIIYISGFIIGIIFVIGLLIILFIMNWKLILFVLVVVLLVVFILILIGWKMFFILWEM